jgi:ubiquinone/menaquinone biosynthesis C-methylase UbiE
MAAATGDFLSLVGLTTGWACLDVGCGDGQVTIRMARAAGPTGRAVGVDADAGALAIAGEAASRAGVRVELVRADAGSPVERDAFDLAYARLVLSHLVEPMSALRAMHDAVRPGGVVAIEDLDTGTLRSDPPTAALDRLQDLYGATVRAHGGDPTIGPRLRTMLAAAGFREAQERTVANPMTEVEDKVFLVELLDNMRETMLDTGVATAAVLDEVRAEVDAAARDPGTVFHQARIHQVHGVRPTERGSPPRT